MLSAIPTGLCWARRRPCAPHPRRLLWSLSLFLFFPFSRTISRSLSRARALSLSRALSLNLALSLSRSLARALSAHASSLSSGVGHVLCTACAWCGVVWRVSLGIARRKQHMLAYTQAMKKAGLIRRVMYDALMYETLYSCTLPYTDTTLRDTSLPFNARRGRSRTRAHPTARAMLLPWPSLQASLQVALAMRLHFTRPRLCALGVHPCKMKACRVNFKPASGAHCCTDC